MVPMSSFHVQIADHTRRVEHANRVEWLVQAAADASKSRPSRRRHVPARFAAVATLVPAVLAVVGLR